MPPCIKTREARLLRLEIARELSQDTPDLEKIRILKAKLLSIGGKSVFMENGGR